MLLSVMRRAEPPDLQRLGIIVVVGMCFYGSADLAWKALKRSSPDGGLYKFMRPRLFWIAFPIAFLFNRIITTMRSELLIFSIAFSASTTATIQMRSIPIECFKGHESLTHRTFFLFRIQQN